MLFKQIVALCEQNGFFNVIKPFKNNLPYFQLGPVGALLQENLKHEWFKNVVTNNEQTIFFTDGDFVKSVEYVKAICSEKLNYGIAEWKSVKVVPDKNMVYIEKNNPETVRPFDTYFMDDTIMKCTVFVPPAVSKTFFHDWQKQRKRWWRKFSSSPSSYSFSEIITTKTGSQNVRVYAKFPWGNETVESIEISSGKHPLLTVEQLQAKDTRKKVQAHYLTSTVSLSAMLLNSLCDCYEETNFYDEHREVMRFHRKIAPYKIGFSSTFSATSKKEDMKDMCLYLCLQLRNLYISCLLLPLSQTDTLESQFKMYDKLGVPYTIIVNDETMKTGVIRLRSRDTTLKEQVHIHELPTYIEKIYRNY